MLDFFIQGMAFLFLVTVVCLLVSAFTGREFPGDLFK